MTRISFGPIQRRLPAEDLVRLPKSLVGQWQTELDTLF